MGVESRLRAWARRSGLQRSRLVVGAYRGLSRMRYAGRWERPVTFRGASFSIGPDLSLYPAVRNGGFESHELDALLSRVRATDTVWDVGGNIGIYAVLLAQAAPAGHVVSFEPVPRTRQRLVENLRRNRVGNVTVESVALSDRAGEAIIRLFDDAPGCDRIVEAEPTDGSASIRVETTTGAAYAARSPFGVPDVIKVDIEGHEPAFLRGMWDVVAARRPTILMEVNPDAWNGDAAARVWQELLDDLFALYGAGLWFDVGDGERVEAVDVAAVSGGPFNLILPAA